MPTLHRRTGLVAVAIAALMLSVAACSSTTEEADPTTTIATKSGTVPSDDEDPGGTTGTTLDDPPRTGTSLIDDDEDPPTGDETEEEYVAALVSTFEEGEDDLFTQEDVECLAAAWVPAIGVETFQAAGVTPADIEAGDAGLEDVVIDRPTGEAIVDAIPGCGLSLMDLFIDGLPSGVKDDPTKVACVEGAVTEDQIRESLIADITGAESEDPEDLVGQCLD